MTPPPANGASAHPEVVSDGFPQRRSRWIEIATSGDHKDSGRLLLTAALGFLFLAVLEFLLMRLQLAIPENTFLPPYTFNRILSAYGATSVFLVLLPLCFGFLYYVVPLQIGARATALPRVGQTGIWLFIAGAFILYLSFMFTPPGDGVNPLSPLTEDAFSPDGGANVWPVATGLATLGFVFIAMDLVTTIRLSRAPGMAYRRMPIFSWAGAICSWLMLVTGPIFIAALTMVMIDRHFDGVFFSAASGGAPLLWQHMSWIFFTGVYVTALITALATVAEIVPTFARRPLFHRRAVARSLAAIAILGTLAWMQNMLTAPIAIAWMYFAMLMSLALIVPIGLVIFNVLATLFGGTLRMRAPLLFALGSVSIASVGLASEIGHSMVAVAWQLKDTTDASAATHFTLIGSGVFGGFAALHYWFPKITGRTMGESLGRASFWTMFAGVNLTFLPLFLAGLQGQVNDSYKFFDHTGVTLFNLIASVGAFVLAAGIILGLVNAVASYSSGPVAKPDQWGADSLEWFAASPPPGHNFDVLPDVRSDRPLRDIRDAVASSRARAEDAPARDAEPVA